MKLNTFLHPLLNIDNNEDLLEAFYSNMKKWSSDGLEKATHWGLDILVDQMNTTITDSSVDYLYVTKKVLPKESDLFKGADIVNNAVFDRIHESIFKDFTLAYSTKSEIVYIRTELLLEKCNSLKDAKEIARVQEWANFADEFENDSSMEIFSDRDDFQNYFHSIGEVIYDHLNKLDSSSMIQQMVNLVKHDMMLTIITQLEDSGESELLEEIVIDKINNTSNDNFLKTLKNVMKKQDKPLSEEESIKIRKLLVNRSF